MQLVITISDTVNKRNTAIKGKEYRWLEFFLQQ